MNCKGKEFIIWALTLVFCISMGSELTVHMQYGLSIYNEIEHSEKSTDKDDTPSKKWKLVEEMKPIHLDNVEDHIKTTYHYPIKKNRSIWVSNPTPPPEFVL